ncbi:MAG: hypothetical protein H6642_11585 [Caldilineaceae bacterium]|nr:hypothetical protein [Caldilineaceae bacterium]
MFDHRASPRFFLVGRSLYRAGIILIGLFLLLPGHALAQSGSDPVVIQVMQRSVAWYVLAAALAMLVPAGIMLISIGDMSRRQARNAALGALAAVGLAMIGYWATGFALQFGGVGLVYPESDLRDMVWEWSMLSSEWGIGWGMAGLSGWFLSGAGVTSQAYALFLAHLPWAITAALIPVVALRSRAQAVATMLLALLMGGVIYPLAGNWVQGGGWLNALGRNLTLGHGFVDFGGAGSVFLLAGSFTLAGLAVWSPRAQEAEDEANQRSLPLAHQPLLAIAGAFMVMVGLLGWLWANPLQMGVLPDAAVLRGSINLLLAAGGGVVIPFLYTWFVSGYSHAVFSARGVLAGMVAGLAAGPFIQPGPALGIGIAAGATVPFVTYLIDALLGLDDRAGAVAATLVPALLGLLSVGFLADGAFGRGWQMTSLVSHLGVTGQGVTGLLAASGFQPDFPGQLQAQLIGLLALGLFGFFSGLVCCIPLGLLLHALQRDDRSAHKRINQPIA